MLHEIEGKVFVTTVGDARDHNKWVKYPDHYYVDRYATSLGARLEDITEEPPMCDAIPCCLKCTEQRQADLSRRQQLLKWNGPLRGLELFAGQCTTYCRS